MVVLFRNGGSTSKYTEGKCSFKYFSTVIFSEREIGEEAGRNSAPENL
jgi:hypothetical protein